MELIILLQQHLKFLRIQHIWLMYLTLKIFLRMKEPFGKIGVMVALKSTIFLLQQMEQKRSQPILLDSFIYFCRFNPKRAETLQKIPIKSGIVKEQQLS